MASPDDGAIREGKPAAGRTGPLPAKETPADGIREGLPPPAADRPPAGFAGALGCMFLGAVLGMIAARAGVGNPWRGGIHGGMMANEATIFAALFFGQVLGAVVWLCLTTKPRSPLRFLLASLVAGMAANASYGLWSEFDSVSFFQPHRPNVSFSGVNALIGAAVYGLWGLVSGTILGVFGSWVLYAGRKPGA